MKQASPDLLALINAVVSGDPSPGGDFGPDFGPDFAGFSIAQIFDFDLYTITPVGGLPLGDFNADFNADFSSSSQAGLFFTTADFDIRWNGITYKSGGIRIDEKSSKVQAHWKVGIDSDQWTVVVMPRPVDIMTGTAFPDTIGGVPWLNAVQAGLLDAADVQVDRAYFARMPTWPMPSGGAVPLGVISGIFAGVVGEVDTTNTIATLVFNDYRSLLSQQMPRHVFQGECRHTLFDTGCTLLAGAFTKNGTALGGSTQVSIAQNMPTPVLAGGAGTYVLGSITFNTGQNVGLTRMINGWNGPGQPFTLLDPFPNPVQSGDSFTVTPGCNKTQAACAAFGNSLNFGGFPYIPAPETA